MTLLVDSSTDRIVQPNGLAFSPMKACFYIIDSRRGQIRAFDDVPNGTLAKQTDRVFADLRGSEPGGPGWHKKSIPLETYSAAGPAASTSLIQRVKSLVGSSTVIPRPPISASAVRTGKHSISPAVPI
jgi:hypothetical protein